MRTILVPLVLALAVVAPPAAAGHLLSIADWGCSLEYGLYGEAGSDCRGAPAGDAASVREPVAAEA